MDSLLRAIESFFEHLAAIDWGLLAIALVCHLLRIVARTRAWRNVIAAAYPDAAVRWRLVAGAYLFAMVTQLQFYGQDWGLALPSQFLAMAPYFATVIALVVISRDVNLTKANAPACIGRPFQPER